MTADASPCSSFITEVTSQDEGVFIDVDAANSIKMNDYKLEDVEISDVEDDESTSGSKTNATVMDWDQRTKDFGNTDPDSFSENTVNPRTKSIEMVSTPVTATNSNEHEETPKLRYYTTQPKLKSHNLSLLQTLREYRHNRCIMTPLSTLVLLAILLSSLISLLFMIPQFIIGLLLGPLLKRQFWLVEFLYRHDIAKWGHVKLMEKMGKSHGVKQGKSRGSIGGTVPKDARKKLKHLGMMGHSDTIYQRITVVPGRVYIHPIPQFVDNLCYLIVCLPNNVDEVELPIVGILIDVGEARRTLAYVECIYEHYYEEMYARCDYYRNSGEEEGNVNTSGMGIEIHAILSTHRHHDHTAGLGELIKCLEQARCRLSKCVYVSGNGDDAKGKADEVYNISPAKVAVVGGAVESVPHCNLFVKNGCFIPLPCVTIDVNGTKVANDMNSVVCIECISVPSHTRGSIVYALRNHPAGGSQARSLQGTIADSHLFTGDAIFSGDSGVPFEADLEYKRDNFIKSPNNLKKKNGSSSFRPGAGTLSMERCFNEVLVRATNSSRCEEEQGVVVKELQSRTLLYPGHEYTTDLVIRQLDPKSSPSEGHWTRLPPSTFFETASHYLVSAHKRALPQGQKLLSLPTPLDRELIVNRNYRSLKRRGEHVLNALRLWHEFGAKNPIPRFEMDTVQHSTTQRHKSTSPFRTVYAQDLDTIVTDLRLGKLTPSSAADRIELIQTRIDEKLIGRRPIPNHLPCHKNVYQGVVALAILGSPPTGVTVSDAQIMDIAAPVDSNDFILISKSRLISSLSSLGLISSNEPVRIQDMIKLLWKEANEPSAKADKANDENDSDFIELGLLKLALFGVAFNQPSCASKYCLPCGNSKSVYSENSWVTTSKMKRTSGELVKHDAERCPVCQNELEPCPHFK